MADESILSPAPVQGVATWVWSGSEWRTLTANAEGQLQVDLTDATISKLGGSISNPPAGYCRVTNIYVNPDNGKLVITYDDTPVP